jgi:phosphatidylglycerophosphatase A
MKWEIPLSFRSKFILYLATGFGLGRLPKAPGTFGTFLGLPLAIGMNRLSWSWAVMGVLLFIIFSIIIAQLAEGILKKQDPANVVIDEVVGMLLTLFALEINFITIILGFILFRILDILKPFPVGWLDKKLTGGIGIVADDVAAGIMSNLILRIILFSFGGYTSSISL